MSRSWHAAVVSSMAAASVLAVTYNNRLMSYNSFTLSGLILVAAGALMLSRGTLAKGTLAVGVGFGVTFTGKPTSALGLVLVSIVVILVLRPAPARWVPVIGTAALTSCVFVFLGTGLSFAQMTTYLSRGAERARLLGGHDSIPAMAGVTPQDVSALILFGFTLGAPAVLSVLAVRRDPEVGPKVVSAFAAFAVVWTAVVFLVFFDSLADTGEGHRMRSLTLLLPALGAALFLGGSLNRRPRLATSESRRAIVLAVALYAGPYIYALGSNTPFSLAMGNAAVLWLAASVIVAARAVHRFPLAIVTVTAACVVLVLVSTSLVDGGSRASLMSATQPTPVDRSRLLMTDADHAVLSQLEAVRRRYGLSADVPIVDLTGIGPGYALQLGGRPLGGGFFMGIFDGAAEAAEYGLSLESCENRARAWVLFADNNPADVSRAFTGDSVNLARDYDVITSFAPTQGPAQWRRLQVKVLRPHASVASALGCP